MRKFLLFALLLASTSLYATSIDIAGGGGGGPGSDTTAIHVDTADEFSGAALEGSPNNSDRILIESNGNSFEKRYITIGTLPTGAGMASFDVSGNAGSAQTITNGNNLSFLGENGINTTANATDTLTIGLDNGTSTNINTALTHVTSDGTDHTYIDQDLRTTATPTHPGLQITPGADPGHNEGLLYYDSTRKTFVAYNDVTTVAQNLGEEVWKRAYNDTGVTINNGAVVILGTATQNAYSITLADADTAATAMGIIGFATNQIAPAGFGYVTVEGTVRGLNTSADNAGADIFLSQTAGEYTETAPNSPAYHIHLGNIGIVDTANGTIEASTHPGHNDQDTIDFYTGAILQDHTTLVTSNGSTVSLNISASGGGDLNLFFNGSFSNFDCTPSASVALTAGSDTSPQLNYVYILKSTLTLTKSTAGWPTTEEFIPVATIVCQTAASVQTDGAYKWHAWTDHIKDSVGQGHLSHLNKWVRNQHATYISGAALTPSVGVGTFDVSIASGAMLQLHEHAMDAFDTSASSEVYMINDPSTANKKVGDLTGELTDSDGDSLSGKSYSLVFWVAGNQGTGEDNLFCNLPSGSYNNSTDAQNDPNNYSNFTIPSIYKGVGLLIARVTVTHSVSGGGTWSLIQNEDLRGQLPQSSAGGASGVTTEFSDNTFRVQAVADTSKELALDVSGVTTATTRTWTVQDKNITVADNADLTSHTGDSTIHFTQGNITTVGTVGTGTWQGTAVADAYVANDITISGGTINNTPIGDTTSSNATFTTVTANLLTDGTINITGGNLTGATGVTATNLTGTLQTAAQGNVTSLGTLTGLTMGGNIDIAGNNIVNTGTLTLPTATDTLVGRDTTDTLTNKTIDADSNTISNLAHGAEVDAPTSNIHQTINPIIIACSGTTSTFNAATLETFRMPYDFTITAVRASLTTAPSGSAVSINITESGTTIFSGVTTYLSIDNTETTSTTAANAYSLADSALADDAEIKIIVTQADSSDAAAGLKVTLIGYGDQ